MEVKMVLVKAVTPNRILNIGEESFRFDSDCYAEIPEEYAEKLPTRFYSIVKAREENQDVTVSPIETETVQGEVETDATVETAPQVEESPKKQGKKSKNS